MVCKMKKIVNSTEFLGFEGPDCEATIDLSTSQSVKNVIVHTLSSGGSWVYPPRSVEVLVSPDGESYTSTGKSEKFETTTGSNGIVNVSFCTSICPLYKSGDKEFRFNPSGLSGAGNKAWLFVDEIEVN